MDDGKERKVTRTGTVFFLALLAADLPDATKVDLKPATVSAFDSYIGETEKHLETQYKSDRFLWTDGTTVRKQHVRDGEVECEPLAADGDVEVPDGLIHDWIGA